MAGTRSALILVDEREVPRDARVWGTGGWLMPEAREALDWLTLCRLLGWSVETLAGHAFARGLVAGGADRFAICAVDPATIDDDGAAALARWLATTPGLIVARAAPRETALARLSGVARATGTIRGRAIRWLGPGLPQTSHARHLVTCHGLTLAGDAAIWAKLGDAPVIAARRVGRGVIATIAFHPSEARDQDGAITALIRRLLVFGAQRPIAWFDHANTMVLRMDDPGAAQNIYSRDWSYPKLHRPDWTRIGVALRRRSARLSVAYVSGWVDDGDPVRGDLFVDGGRPKRIPGRVHYSPLVRYCDRAGHAPGRNYDARDEYRGIQALRRAGLAEVELHGFTHMHPDPTAWAAAEDRYTATRWYRELGRDALPTLAKLAPARHPIARGAAALRRFYAIWPTTLVSPGDEWTDEALHHALDRGLRLVSSYYLALRHGDRFVWCQHVCAPYLDVPEAHWFDSGLPVVGYLHDRDIALYGVRWLARHLDAWRSAGARRLIDFRELAAATERTLDLSADGTRLTVRGRAAPAAPRPLPVRVRRPDGRIASMLDIVAGHDRRRVRIAAEADGTGRLALD